METVERRWFTTKEAAEMLGTTVVALQRMVQRGRLKPDCTRFKGYRFKLETLEAFASGRSAA